MALAIAILLAFFVPTTQAGFWTTERFGNWQDSGYKINNNVWGNPAGPQSLWAKSATNWGVTANHPQSEGGVKSYPHVSKHINKRISELKGCGTSFSVSVPGGDAAYAAAYDLWADNSKYEIMLWMYTYGKVGPISHKYDGNGAVPVVRNLNVGGHTWNVYNGTNGHNQVFSFMRTQNTNSGTVDLMAIFNWLKNNNWWGNVLLGSQQFGFEISKANGNLPFAVNNYNLWWW